MRINTFTKFFILYFLPTIFPRISSSPLSRQVHDYEDNLALFKLVAKQLANTINFGIIDVASGHTKVLCQQLFGPIIDTYGSISGAYMDTISTDKRCGYVSDSTAENGYVYMTNGGENNSANLSYYSIGSNFSAIKRDDRYKAQSYDPRHETWYNEGVDDGGMRWSALYIHPMTKKATITLTVSTSNEILIALDLQLEDLTRHFNHFDHSDEFIIERQSHIIVSSSLDGLASKEKEVSYLRSDDDYQL
jgi:hypothetical protein